MKDPALRQALNDARAVVLAVRRGMGARSWTERELARQSGVDRGTLRAVLAGESWPSLPTMSRLLRAVGASLRVDEEEIDDDQEPDG